MLRFIMPNNYHHTNSNWLSPHATWSLGWILEIEANQIFTNRPQLNLQHPTGGWWW